MAEVNLKPQDSRSERSEHLFRVITRHASRVIIEFKTLPTAGNTSHVFSLIAICNEELAFALNNKADDCITDSLTLWHSVYKPAIIIIFLFFCLRLTQSSLSLRLEVRFSHRNYWPKALPARGPDGGSLRGPPTVTAERSISRCPILSAYPCSYS